MRSTGRKFESWPLQEAADIPTWVRARVRVSLSVNVRVMVRVSVRVRVSVSCAFSEAVRIAACLF